MRKLIAKIFPYNSRGYLFLFKLYDFQYWFPKFWLPTRWPKNILPDYAKFRKDVSFIQIGSNNGMSGDPIYKYIIANSWHGVLIEPVPYLFDMLKQTYAGHHEHLSFENSAIAASDGHLKFYRLEKTSLPGLPDWYDQLGSFNKEVILKHRTAVPFFDDLFVEDNVNAITFATLLKKHEVSAVKLIHIDTEGYDFEILKMIPFQELKVELIMFEHVHLSNEDYKKAIRLLRSAGYILGIADTDTVGIHKDVWPLIKKSLYV